MQRRLLLLGLLWSANALAAEPADRATVVVVIGAEGSSEFGKQFADWGRRWESHAAEAGARTIMIGTPPAGKTTDRDRLRQVLVDEPKEGAGALWLVLLGHGTFDGKAARFNLRGPDVSAAELAEWLRPIRRPTVVIDASASSAPFLNALSAPDRVVVTATRSGGEENFCRFGGFITRAIGDPEADLDRDGQVSVLEAFLRASRQVEDYYRNEGRLATEHALVDDNGDGLGTPAEWFQGFRAVRKADRAQTVDGSRAHQLQLLPSEMERRIPPPLRAERDRLELAIENLRSRKESLSEEDYYRQLEILLLDLARLYEKIGDQPHPNSQ